MENATPIITIDLVLDRLTTKDVLRALLHAILFHRLFGTIKPQTMEVLDVTVPGVKDAQVEMLIDEKVDAFWKGVENGTNKRGQITITFAEKRQKKLWFTMGEVGFTLCLVSYFNIGKSSPFFHFQEEVPWEKWIINAEVRHPKTDRERNATISTTLSDALMTILTYTSSERGRSAVPPITSTSGISPFPFKIGVKVAGVEVD
ncbi:hypothetical protein ACEPAH_1333 [Sanghuangporus vaninii]